MIIYDAAIQTNATEELLGLFMDSPDAAYRAAIS